MHKIAKLCIENDVIIISDEIHADLVFKHTKHTPIASLSKEVAMQTVTCLAPSKTFNLAGLQASYVITENPKMREDINQLLDRQGLTSLNTMGNTALYAAYKHGEAWLEELLETLDAHQQYVVKMFDKYLPELKVMSPEGTYLLWIDCRGLKMNDEELQHFMIHKARVGLNAGNSYGEEGNQFMRMNIATSKQTLEEGVDRIIQAVKKQRAL